MSDQINQQLGMPVVVTEIEISRERTLGGALGLCAKAAGFDLDKELQQELEVDKGQFSRWLNGQEGIVWTKFQRLMDLCGNDAPLLWMNYQRGYDIGAMRKRETELEKQVRERDEKIAQLEAKFAHFTEFARLK